MWHRAATGRRMDAPADAPADALPGGPPPGAGESGAAPAGPPAPARPPLAARVARGGLRGTLRGARWTWRLSGLSLLAALGVALALPLLLVGQEVTAPSWLRERVEAAASDALGGGSLRFGAISVTVGGDLHPRVRLLDATLRDAEGRTLARVPEVSARLSPRGLLFERRLLVQEIALSGPEVDLARRPDGSVDLSFRAGGEAGVGRVEGLAGVPGRVAGVFDRPALEALRRVAIEGLVVNYEDQRAGRAWTLDGGSLALLLDREGLRLRGDVAVLSGGAGVTRATLDYASPRDSLAATLAVTLTDVAAADVASQAPALAWLSVVDAPISVAFRGALDEGGALGPLSVALKIAEGRLRPRGGAAPVPFESLRAYLAYDPAARTLRLDSVALQSAWGSLEAEGRAWLGDVRGGMPREVVAQLALSDVVATPPGLFEAPLRLPAAEAQARVRFDPFVVEIAEASADLGGGEAADRLLARGRLAASGEGWEVALDARLGRLAYGRLLALWPEARFPGVREWIGARLTAGALGDVAAAFRLRPGAAPALSLSAALEDVTLRPLDGQPPVEGAWGRLSWEGGDLAVALDRGRVAAPEGGDVDVAGLTFALPGGGGPTPPAEVGLSAAGSVTALLSLLDQPPWRLLSRAGLSPDLAEGRARASGTIALRLGTGEGLAWDVAASLSEVASDSLVPGRRLAAQALELRADVAGLRVAGEATLDGISASGTFSLPFREGRPVVEADVALSPATLAAVGVGLPEGSVAGEGRARLRVELGEGAPAFSLRSDLRGLGLALPAAGWSKAARAEGQLVVEGRLGAPVRVDRLALTAPGLSAEGSASVTAAGGLDRLTLDRLRVGDWLDVGGAVVGRGSRPVALEVAGGTLDLSRADFGTGGRGAGGGGPISASLDRVQVTEGIALTGFHGEFTTEFGLEGTFRARVNGVAPVWGRVAPQGGRVGARVQGDDAGAVLAAAGLFARAVGGSLDMLLLPVGEAGYEGELSVAGLTVRDAPVLASLLNAVSVVGLLQQLGEGGIVFDDVAARFRLDPGGITLTQGSAVGAGLGLSLDGTYAFAAGRMDFQGVLSPLYLVNGLGSVLTRPGEGLIGFSFTLRGDPADPAVAVNPLSVLTPGMFRDIFRRPPPT